MKVYAVKMNRFGNDELHSYMNGVYSSEELARKAGLAEEYWRGGKYVAQIWLYNLDQADKEVTEYLEDSCGGYNKKQGNAIELVDKTKRQEEISE